MSNDVQSNLPRVTVNKYNNDRRNMVRGTIEFLPNPNIQYTSIYSFLGLGAFFSGDYYMVSVTHSWSSSGYRVTGEAIKQQWDGTAEVDNYDIYNNRNPSSAASPSPRPSRPVMQSPTQSKTHTVSTGDTLWSIADYYYGDGTKWSVIEQANHTLLVQRDSRNSDGQGHWIYPAMKLIIP